MKLTVFIIIELALSYCIAMQFCGKLEVASATRANKADGTKTRSLELGHTGRAMLMVAIFIEFALIALLSKWLVVVTLVVMIISMVIVWVNIYLRGVGIEAFVPLLLLWVGNIVASLFQQSKVGAESRWALFFIIFEIVMLAFLLAGTAVVKFNRYRRMYMDEEDADDWEERKERIIRTALNGLIVILIIAVAVIIMYWLEVKFDFLPPHRI